MSTLAQREVIVLRSWNASAATPVVPDHSVQGLDRVAADHTAPKIVRAARSMSNLTHVQDLSWRSQAIVLIVFGAPGGCQRRDDAR